MGSVGFICLAYSSDNNAVFKLLVLKYSIPI